MTTLTVQSAPLSITTTSLSNAVLNASYSSTLAAVGGTTPYSWTLAQRDIAYRASPVERSGVISGTPTVAGIYNFTVRASDSSTSPQTSSPRH